MVMKNKFIGLDTNVFIYFFENNPQFAPTCISIFNMLQDKRARAVTSILTLTELLSLKMSEERVIQLQHEFLQLENLQVIAVDQILALEAARIRREYNFRISDCFQLATAKYAKVDIFVTNDRRLKTFKEVAIMLLDEHTSFV